MSGRDQHVEWFDLYSDSVLILQHAQHLKVEKIKFNIDFFLLAIFSRPKVLLLYTFLQYF